MIARAATRATAAALPANATRQALIRRQNVSLMRSLRDFARGFEPHPFQRLPVASNPAPADYGRLVKRVSQQLVVYPLVAFGLLGWPYVAYKLVDGHV